MGRFVVYAIIFSGLIVLSSCSPVETVRKVWGSSTETLEDARINALTKTFACSFDECFEAVLALQRPVKKWYESGEGRVLDNEIDQPQEESPLLAQQAVDQDDPSREGQFNVFLKNRIKRHIVVIGVPGNIETTEVGIFFVRLTPEKTKVEISSLSSSAKRTAAAGIFQELSSKFGEESE